MDRKRLSGAGYLLKAKQVAIVAMDKKKKIFSFNYLFWS